MLDSETIRDLNKAFQGSAKGFLVLDSGKPKFAVLDYETYKEMAEQKSEPAVQSPSSRVLVTGGAGYIGAHTVRMMQQQGYEVVVYDNLSTGREESVVGCDLIVADLADKQKLDKVFQQYEFDAVVHFAAAIEVEESVKEPAKYFENNVVNSINLLEVMRAHRVGKLIFSSSCAVYGNAQSLPIVENAPVSPESPYGLTKVMFEQVLEWYGRAYGIDVVSLRYFNAAGAWPAEKLGYAAENNPMLIPRVLEVASGRLPEIRVFGQNYDTPDGTAVRDYIHVLDLAEAHMVALENLMQKKGFYVYNLGTGQGNTVLEVIDMAVEITGRMIPMSVTDRRPGDPAALFADTTKAEQELGWRAKHDLTDILQDAWEWRKHQK